MYNASNAVKCPSALALKMELIALVEDIANAVVAVDASKVAFKTFQPGVGPYGEPQLVRAIASHLNTSKALRAPAKTKRTPDLVVGDEWAVEFKIARPFGDNGREAENWSVNLLHPYAGSTSLIGDSLKLGDLAFGGRKAVVVIGYEHTPPRISLAPLFAAFEVVARTVVGIRLGDRIERRRAGLTHPVHQALVVAAWQILDPAMTWVSHLGDLQSVSDFRR